jgi:hypothetical protein
MRRAPTTTLRARRPPGELTLNNAVIDNWFFGVSADG